VPESAERSVCRFRAVEPAAILRFGSAKALVHATLKCAPFIPLLRLAVALSVRHTYYCTLTQQFDEPYKLCTASGKQTHAKHKHRIDASLYCYACFFHIHELLFVYNSVIELLSFTCAHSTDKFATSCTLLCCVFTLQQQAARGGRRA
jgi:hypothetical protein